MNPYGTKFLRVLSFARFHDPQKQVTAKKGSRENLLHCRVGAHLQKQKEIRNKAFRNKTMKLQSVLYRYLAVKSLKEKDHLKVLH